jgi:hypothetical protein
MLESSREENIGTPEHSWEGNSEGEMECKDVNLMELTQ